MTREGLAANTRWTPGQWSTVVAPDGKILLPPNAPGPLLDQLWDLLHAEGSVDLAPILDSMISSAGGRIADVPDFALVLTDSDNRFRVVLRGAPVVEVGGETIDASPCTTWKEMLVNSETSFIIRCENADGLPEFLVKDAVLQASSLRFGEEALSTENEDEAEDPDAATAEQGGSNSESEHPEAVLDNDPAPLAPIEQTEQDAPADDAEDAPVCETTVIMTAFESASAPQEPVQDDPWSNVALPSLESTRTDTVSEMADQEANDEAAPSPDPQRPGDHDGHTISHVPDKLLEEIERWQVGESANAGERPEPSTVMSAKCSNGHDNPTNRTECLDCGRPLDQPAVRIAQPTLGTMTTSEGENIALDEPILVGRSPVVQAGVPVRRTVKVPSHDRTISRNHVLITMEGWSVLAQDLRTNNGTMLLREGEAPRRLSDAHPTLLRSGDRLDLGDGVTLGFQDIP